MTATKKRKPGASIPDSQRHTVLVQARAQPEDAALLPALQDAWGETKSGAVGRALREAAASLAKQKTRLTLDGDGFVTARSARRWLAARGVKA